MTPSLEAKKPGRLIALLYLAAMLFQVVAIRRAVTYYDEQLELYDAEQLLHHHLPYRDFWTLYGPAQSATLALFIKFFGINVLSGRFYDALIKAAIACVCFVLVDRLAGRKTAILAFAASLLCLTCTTSAIYNFPIFPALFCGLIGIYFLSRFLEQPAKLSHIVLAGVFTGLTTTFRHDSGFYFCLTELATLLWFARSQRRSLARIAAAYFAGLFLIVLPVFAWLLWKIPLHDLYFDLIYLPGKVYPKVRNLPFPTFRTLWPYLHPFGQRSLYAIEDWIVYLPILAFATAAIALIASRQSERLWPNRWQRATFASLTLLTALLYIKGLVRVTEIHQMQTIVLASALTLILFAQRIHLRRIVRIPVFACAICLLAYSSLLLWHAATFLRWNVRDLVRTSYHESFANTCNPPAGLERIRCFVVDRDTIAAVEYVQKLTDSNDPIYVGAGRHDKLAMNDVRFYFISGRASITKWYDLHPGVQTTRPIQQEIVDSIQQQKPKVIVLNDAWDDIIEPNESQYSSGVTLLDDTIRSRYTASASFGPYLILTPKPVVYAAGSDSK